MAELTHPHTCGFSAIELAAMKFKNKVREAIQASNEPPQDVYDRLIAKESAEVQIACPLDTVYNIMRYKRKSL